MIAPSAEDRACLAVGLVTLAAQRDLGTALHSYAGLGIVDRTGITCPALAFDLWKTLLPFGLSPLYELGRVDAWPARRLPTPVVAPPSR